VTVIFLTLKDEKYSRTWTYYSALRNIGIDSSFIRLDLNTVWRDLKKLKSDLQDQELKVIVGSASQLLVLPVLLIFKHKPYLDAGWSLLESTMVNRKRAGFLGRNLLKTYLIDFIATQFSKKIFLESDLQVKWYVRTFLTSKRKCVTLYTGLDESDFTPEIKGIKKKSKDFNVVFRGKVNDEAGLAVLAEATRILSGQEIKFIVLSNSRNLNAQFSNKTTLITQFFESKNEIATYLTNADLSLGQLSNHKRLKRTIPHKAFESAYLGVPYLTARNLGILEIFEEEKEVFCFEPGSAKDLARQIQFLKENRAILENSSGKLRARYRAQLSQGLLGEELLRHLTS